MALLGRKKPKPQEIVPEPEQPTIDSGLTAPTETVHMTNPTAEKANQEKPKMRVDTETDDEELGSIVEYSENIDDAEAPLPLPEGTYEAEIKAVERKLSGNNKKYAAVSFFISADSYPADFPIEEAPDGLTLVFRKLSLENNKMSRFNVKRFIQNIGAPPVAKTLDLTTWVGLRAKVVIKHDKWEGTIRPTIDKVLAAA